MKILILSFFLILGINLVFCQSSISLSATIYDQSPARNPDFEIPNAPNAVVKNMVLSTLGADKTPTYCCGDNGVYYNGQFDIHSQSTFDSWFHEIEGISYAVPYELVLIESKDEPGIYVYTSSSFFPIDGKGFDNKTLYPDEITYNGHNYHFCMKIHSSFTYHGGEYFTFAGDDDVWVYFDNNLLIDLGGLHTSASETVYLDNLGLTIGQSFPFDFFYCERHTYESNLNIITNLNLTCIEYDACGVCLGKNDTCCFVNKCETINRCLEADCNEGTNFQCDYHIKNCSDGDICSTDGCDIGFGCINLPINCDDGNYCTKDYCDPTYGCLHIETANCTECLETGCITVLPCFPVTCDSLNSSHCVASAMNCSDNDPCTSTECVNGECTYEWICGSEDSSSGVVDSSSGVVDSSSDVIDSSDIIIDSSSDIPIPTLSPSPQPSRFPTDTPTNTPMPPTRPPTPTEDPKIYEDPEDLDKDCLHCKDLGCILTGKSCGYLKNEKYEKSNCKENCCSHTPTCF
ncbi:PA14 domain-containing protein [Dictyostelium discoideum AX4]|uniref:Protein psiC n=1 Tax=Dictyostelium discoideum TaxID=44689 RepID=PSIC_DICDI|nr:PA14 domain-containing protein [Dictyostelium discoideum AX4]Q1ZXC5.1 RecName: Full=Protein psiC; Flags: Precursor [Dictyostelium discoideum]EAS66830.1 PA14 domain-containing protein [Dictyostelium discoideum AX4]|eukprot:XP_001134513.1 PA14 domain-containing protein [Dictyostelium discoideum AX4]